MIEIPTNLDTKNLRVGIVQSRFNPEPSNLLLSSCVEELRRHKVLDSNIVVLTVPGALEIPYGLKKLYDSKFSVDVLVALGVVVRGETYHFDVVARESARRISEIAMKIPVINGVLTVYEKDQALKRAKDKGIYCAISAIEMADLESSIDESYDKNE